MAAFSVDAHEILVSLPDGSSQDEAEQIVRDALAADERVESVEVRRHAVLFER